ncbi:VOC family protein [Shinella kummerowiae]|uniref:VOC family protein n=1 Tax=Shinella kummerowiae TaxID=417745 RepID=UPI0021B566EC|nr:VOC family protein [Shinella kummerowiae]MCT7665550.1 VOC family protein [Shinella kummerowiae]
MNQSLAHIALIVRDYDEAIAFYVNTLGFELVDDTYQAEQDKRWVVVRPKGTGSCSIVLARASSPDQARYVGDQAGGRVFLFLRTDDFWRDYHALVEKGVAFEREPKTADYGIVAVFKDLYGNLWDLIEFTDGRP